MKPVQFPIPFPWDMDQLAQCRICGRPFWVDYNTGDGWRYCSSQCKRVTLRARRRAYEQTPSGKAARRQQAHVRRLRKAGFAAEWEKFTPFEIYARDNWVCQICKKKVLRRVKHPHPLSASIDHIVPLSQGGPHTKANVQLAHFQCNSTKREFGTDQLRLIG